MWLSHQKCHQMSQLPQSLTNMSLRVQAFATVKSDKNTQEQHKSEWSFPPIHKQTKKLEKWNIF